MVQNNSNDTYSYISWHEIFDLPNPNIAISAGAQNKGQKLVSHSLKVETLLQNIIGFPIKNVQ